MSQRSKRCKKCRRVGEKICFSAKCATLRRNYPPGIHGPKGRPRQTEYGIQLMEKQKAKWIYNIRERQFRNYYAAARKIEGDTGQILASLLEKRLDNVVFRLGLATSRRMARQMVGHGHFLVNDRRVDIPSYSVRTGDVIGLREKSQSSPLFSDATKRLSKHQTPSWLVLDLEGPGGKVTGEPTDEDLRQNIDFKKIVEFYSR